MPFYCKQSYCISVTFVPLHNRRLSIHGGGRPEYSTGHLAPNPQQGAADALLPWARGQRLYPQAVGQRPKEEAGRRSHRRSRGTVEHVYIF